jgi:hypothetical protein
MKFRGPDGPTVSWYPNPVGRYQAVSHEGRLVLLDTSSGECWTLEGHAWTKHAPPVSREQENDGLKPKDSPSKQ